MNAFKGHNTFIVMVFLGMLFYTHLSGHPLLEGTGIAHDPYRIYTVEQLLVVDEFSDTNAYCFTLMNDLDFTSRSAFDKALIKTFSGTLNGSGFAIKNITLNGSSNLGLFATLKSTAVVRDLTISGIDIQFTGDNVGALAAANLGQIRNCHSNGQIQGNNSYMGQIGGLVGTNQGLVAHCSSNVDVTAETVAGGLAGANQNGIICHSHSTGSVSGLAEVGGLVGGNRNGNISFCHSASTTSGQNYVGGLVGYNNELITSAYATGDVTGSEWVGGFLGSNDVDGTVSQCYSIGMVSGCSTTESPSGAVLVQGFSGINNGHIDTCFWNLDIFPDIRETKNGATGLPTAALKERATYINAGWDFADETENGWVDPWVMSTEQGYPELRKSSTLQSTKLTGRGINTDPYLIYAARDLAYIAQDPAASYRLMNPIDVGDTIWSSAIIPAFMGALDGGSHTISNLTMEGSGHLGLFGMLLQGASVRDLTLNDIQINSTGDYVGALAGKICHASLDHCHITGQIVGKDYTGTLVGQNYFGILDRCSGAGSVAGTHASGGLVGANFHMITRCVSSADVTGTTYTGGFIGSNQGSVASSYAKGTVYGTSVVGGLVGGNRGDIRLSYSTGKTSADDHVGGLAGVDMLGIQYCFWDRQTSDCPASAAGVGQNSDFMKDPNIYALNGWALNNDWLIDPYQDYPHLRWEGLPGQVIPTVPMNWLPGDGSQDSPYLIQSPLQLMRMAAAGMFWDKCYRLTADLDLIHYGIPPIGCNNSTRFSGTFDGAGHTISNYKDIQSGLFGYLAPTAHLTNLTLQSTVIPEGQNTGGLVNFNYGKIKNCHSDSHITGSEKNPIEWYSGYWGKIRTAYLNKLGGLAGINYGTIESCTSTGNIVGDRQLGGMVGWNVGQITLCQASTEVSGQSYLGGLAGCNFGTILDCRASGQTHCNLEGYYHGGLVGENDGRISRCAATGDVFFARDIDSIGGLVGGNWGSISNSYARNNIHGVSYQSYPGGLVGWNNGFIEKCYVAGRMQNRNTLGPNGLIGDGYGDYSPVDSFYDAQSYTGRKYPYPALPYDNGGCNTKEMQTLSTYLNVGWDFTGETANGMEDIWRMPENDYPRLWWEALD